MAIVIDGEAAAVPVGAAKELADSTPSSPKGCLPSSPASTPSTAEPCDSDADSDADAFGFDAPRAGGADVLELCQRISGAWAGSADEFIKDCGELLAKALVAGAVPEAERQMQEGMSCAAPPMVPEAFELKGSLEPLWGELPWIQPGHLSEDFGRRMGENFKYTMLVGDSSQYGCYVHSDEIHLGLAYISPHVDYPPHAHEAAELYEVLAGEAEWYLDGRREKAAPGTFRVHHPRAHHGTYTDESPVVAIYMWKGDVNGPYWFTDAAAEDGAATEKAAAEAPSSSEPILCGCPWGHPLRSKRVAAPVAAAPAADEEFLCVDCLAPQQVSQPGSTGALELCARISGAWAASENDFIKDCGELIAAALTSGQVPEAARRMPEGMRCAAPPMVPEAFELKGSLEPLWGELPWIQPGHLSEDYSRRMGEGMKYTMLVGDSSQYGCYVHSDEIHLGLVYIAPNVSYPPHAHDAAELYEVLAGEADWYLDGLRETAAPGTFRVHHPRAHHGTYTDASPLVAIYMWKGDVHGPYWFTDAAETETVDTASTALAPPSLAKYGNKGDLLSGFSLDLPPRIITSSTVIPDDMDLSDLDQDDLSIMAV